MLFARLRLSTQLLVLTLGTAAVAIMLMVIMAVFLSRQVIQRESDQRLTALSEAAADLLAAPLIAQDRAAAQQVLAVMVRDEGLDRALILAPDGTLVADQRGDAIDTDDLSRDDRDFALGALSANQSQVRDDADNLSDIAVPIADNGQVRGVLLGQASSSGALDELIDIVLPQMSAAGLAVALLAALLALVVARYIAAPLRKLAASATAVGRGQLEALPTLHGGAEVGALATAFDQMVADLRASQAEVAQQQNMLETRVRERTADLERTLAELQESITTREQLSATVRGLSSPIIPVLDGILVMPLIGVIDTQRSTGLVEALLRGVERYRAGIVILDVTGVPIIDTQVARTLLEAARAVRLLGSQTILVGLRPELAQTIVGLGLDLSNLSAQADLQSAVTSAMHQRKR
jgi:anti-anti-sigma regulatory factor/HAMP domain-containing protein